MKVVFLPWVQVYMKWLGICQLLSFNLAGVIWLIWASKMAKERDYNSKWPFIIHCGLFVIGLISLIMIVFGNIEGLTIRVFWHKIERPSPVLLSAISAIIIILSAIPFFGIKKFIPPNKGDAPETRA